MVYPCFRDWRLRLLEPRLVLKASVWVLPALQAELARGMEFHKQHAEHFHCDGSFEPEALRSMVRGFHGYVRPENHRVAPVIVDIKGCASGAA